MRVTITAAAIGLVLIGLTPANAWGQSGSVTPYTLDSGSSLARGCFGPCACPVLQSKMGGTFDLRSLRQDPLFSYYAVENVDWIAAEPGHSVHVTGSGTYQVGGEVAAQERMILDLSIDGGATQRYDSGNVAGGGDYPRITIEVRIHTSPSCFDTVFTIASSPGVLGIDPREARWPRVSPNPFATRTDVRFALRNAGAVDVAIHDLTGRRMRRLARGLWLDPGMHTVSWDGTGEDGAAVPAGLYRVFVQADGRTVERGIVKLK